MNSEKMIIGYARVSTERQADSGVSLEAQAEKLKAMAVVQGGSLDDLIVDAGHSAKNLDRPGIRKLLMMVDTGRVATVIIAKLDRLTRSVKDLADLLELFEKRGVALVSVADSLDTRSASGRLVLNIMTSVSQWEREAIGERTRDALQHKKSQKERTGEIPYGYRLSSDGIHLEPEPKEQEALNLMSNLHQQGLSFRAIATYLNDKGVKNRFGGIWYHSQIRTLVRRKAA